MCGIAGIVRAGRITPSDNALVQSIMMALRHRGPDGTTLFASNRVVMGNTRLSIIDPCHGWQPFHSEDGTVVLVVNGEIYNQRELRHRLVDRGHRFQGGSDCEVILHLYEDHQQRCVDFLRGMFAFALWDERRQTMLLARDRMGEKPLYITQKDQCLIFASELLALTSSVARTWDPDPFAIDDYFRHNYIEEPRTAIRGIRKLRAGSILTLYAPEWSIVERTYWRIEDAPPVAACPRRLLREEFERACELATQADVPVGIGLSGGVDSTAIAVAARRRLGPGALHAFSVGYGGRPQNDERVAASTTARRLEMPFTEVELGALEVAEGFPRMVMRRGDPIADIAGSAYDALFRLANEAGVKVLLMGHGGDELFWGYEWVRTAATESMDRVKRLAGGRAWSLRHLRELAPRGATPRDLYGFAIQGLGVPEFLRRYRRLASGARPPAFYEVVPGYDASVRALRSFYTADFREQLDDSVGSSSHFSTRADIDTTARICETYLRENGLSQADRLGMAHSVETRSPFVDHRFVEATIGLRKSFPDHQLRPKQTLIEAILPLLPAEVRGRKKLGFTPPIRLWHREIFRRHGRLLEDGQLVRRRILRREAASELAAGAFPIGRGVPLSMKALVLELWLRSVIS